MNRRTAERRIASGAKALAAASPWKSGLLEEGEPLCCEAPGGTPGVIEDAGGGRLAVFPGRDAAACRMAARRAAAMDCGTARREFLAKTADRVLVRMEEDGKPEIRVRAPGGGEDEVLEAAGNLLIAAAAAAGRGEAGTFPEENRESAPEAVDGWFEAIDCGTGDDEGEFFVWLAADGTGFGIGVPGGDGILPLSGDSFFPPGRRLRLGSRDAGFAAMLNLRDFGQVRGCRLPEERIPPLDAFEDSLRDVLHAVFRERGPVLRAFLKGAGDAAPERMEKAAEAVEEIALSPEAAGVCAAKVMANPGFGTLPLEDLLEEAVPEMVAAAFVAAKEGGWLDGGGNPAGDGLSGKGERE